MAAPFAPSPSSANPTAPMRRLLLLLALLAPALASAQTPGTCSLGTAQADLTTPDLSARLFDTGALFYGSGASAAYVVPRSRSTSPMYAASLWAGGRVNGEVRTAGSTYGAPSLAYTFWPGPLDAGAALPNPTDCSAYDRIWLVTPADVAAYESGGTPATDLAQWPVGLGAPAVDAQGLPVPIGSREQRLDLPGGERPVLGGGPTAFWVMNDAGNVRAEAGAQPLGVEVQVTAFAPEVGALAFRQGTFYRYRVVNRNSVPITDFHVGMFADTDLGDASDDLVGVDTTRGMAFTYNADDQDGSGTAGPFGGTYGVRPPAFGLDVLSGMYAAPFMDKNSGLQPIGEPDVAAEFYNRLRGLWNDGTPIREYADGYGESQGVVTRYSFPGDPVTNAFWSLGNPGPGLSPVGGRDMRVQFSGPPVTLAPGAATTFDVGMLFAQSVDRLASVSALRHASDLVQATYDSGELFSGQLPDGTAGPVAPALLAPSEGASFYETAVTFEWDAVPGATGYLIEISPTADFALLDFEVVAGTSVTIPAERFAPNRTDAQFWRVRSVGGDLIGDPSAARGVRVYRYVPRPLTLASGALAYVETTAPGGGPACEPNDPDDGCAEVGGDAVFESLNSTGAYRLINFLLGEDSPAAFAPNDSEIRFTARGSYAVRNASGGVPARVYRVPFEAWDIGPTVPGSANDPSDDVQLIVRLGSAPESAGPCSYEFSNLSTVSDSLATPYIVAYYPAENDYAAFETLAVAAVSAAPDGCATDAALVDPARALLDVPRGHPLYGFSLEQAAARSVADLAGTTVRFYTTDRAVAAEDAPEQATALRLGAAFPNPARGALTVPVSLPTAGRLRLVDVLGRTVLDVRLDAGQHRVRLDTARIAAGVYAIVLEAGAERAVRTVTVVR